MHRPDSRVPETTPSVTLDRLLAATELLERLAADWSLLDPLPVEARARLHRAVAGLTTPDAKAGRKRAREAERARKAERIRREEAVLHETGIRALRRRPLVTAPNLLPPPSEAVPTLRRRAPLTPTSSASVTSARRRTPPSTTSTISSVRSAPTSTSPPAPSWRTFAGAWRS